MGVSFPTVKVALEEGAYMPERAHDTDAGADIMAPHDVLVPARGSAFVNTGVHVQLPHITKGEIRPKSGLFRYAGILTDGLIDEGYDGAIGVTLYNLSDAPHLFHRGDKLCQLVVSPVCYPTYEQTEKIEGGERGDGGFGSTGV